MKRLHFSLAALTLLIGMATWLSSGKAQDPARPAYLENFNNGQPPASDIAFGMQQPASAARNTQPEVEPNLDIVVKPEYGPWMVSIISYNGPQAAQMAREMVIELRGPKYNLPAYVFNYAAERRLQEKKIIDDLVAKKKESYRRAGCSEDVHIPRPKMTIEDQCAVLVGGYNSDNAARRALDAIRRLTPPDPSRVKVDMIYSGQTGATEGTGQMEIHPANPFTHSFVVHNPSKRMETSPDRNKLDIGVLRKMNSSEDYSLFKCPKRFTLAVAGFSLPTVVMQQNAPSSFWDKLGLGKSSERGEDAAAHSAHGLADQLRKKQNVEAYVLHMKYSSLVTVGSYESANDPRLQQMQEQFSRLSAHPAGQQLQLFPDPKPMEVPR